RHPNQTENGKGKRIISGERRRPEERVGSQSQPDHRSRKKSKKQPMVRVHFRNRLQHSRHAKEKTGSWPDRQVKVGPDRVISDSVYQSFCSPLIVARPSPLQFPVLLSVILGTGEGLLTFSEDFCFYSS